MYNSLERIYIENYGGDKVNDLKILGTLYKNNPIMILTTLAGAVVGAIAGVLAYYNGWLG